MFLEGISSALPMIGRRGGTGGSNSFWRLRMVDTKSNSVHMKVSVRDPGEIEAKSMVSHACAPRFHGCYNGGRYLKPPQTFDIGLYHRAAALYHGVLPCGSSHLNRAVHGAAQV